MGESKTTLFTAEQQQLANWAKALAHPARIAILQVLIKKGSCICSDVVEELPLSQATVSQHLKAMKEAGLIQGDIEGRTVCYCADAAACQRAGAALQEIMSAFKDCC
jgi:DNA-binding transcriptional ArsR family regulator